MEKICGELHFKDETTAQIELKKVQGSKEDPKSWIYWFDYANGEKNKQLIHPEYGKNDEVLTPIPLTHKMLNELVFNLRIV